MGATGECYFLIGINPYFHAFFNDVVNGRTDLRSVLTNAIHTRAPHHNARSATATRYNTECDSKWTGYKSWRKKLYKDLDVLGLWTGSSTVCIWNHHLSTHTLSHTRGITDAVSQQTRHLVNTNPPWHCKLRHGMTIVSEQYNSEPRLTSINFNGVLL